MPMWGAHGWEFQTCAPKSVPAAREFAAKAAARRLPLKRQYDVSSLTSAEPRVDSRTSQDAQVASQIYAAYARTARRDSTVGPAARSPANSRRWSGTGRCRSIAARHRRSNPRSEEHTSELQSR